jgi:hypothetical protein
MVRPELLPDGRRRRDACRAFGHTSGIAVFGCSGPLRSLSSISDGYRAATVSHVLRSRLLFFADETSGANNGKRQVLSCSGRLSGCVQRKKKPACGANCLSAVQVNGATPFESGYRPATPVPSARTAKIPWNQGNPVQVRARRTARVVLLRPVGERQFFLWPSLARRVGLALLLSGGEGAATTCKRTGP